MGVTKNLRAASFEGQPLCMRFLFVLGVALCACGGPPVPREPSGVRPLEDADAFGPSVSARDAGAAIDAPQLAVSPHAASASVSGRTLRRATVVAAVSQGLGVFLQRVDVDDRPARVGGKFYGFRVAALRGDSFWSGVDLKPGDVVTSVNGFAIERPEQAKTAFDSLAVASELRVAYDRDGQSRELVYTIVDER